MADSSNPSDVRNLFLKLFQSPVPMAPDSPFGIPRDQLVPMLRDADVVIGVVKGSHRICWAHRRLSDGDVIDALAEVEGCHVKRVRVPCGCEADLGALAALTERVKQCALVEAAEAETTTTAADHDSDAATSEPAASEDEAHDELEEDQEDEGDDDGDVDAEPGAELDDEEDSDGFTDDGQVECTICGDGDCETHELARWCPGSSFIDGRLADMTADLRTRLADLCSQYLRSGQTANPDDCSAPLWDLLDRYLCPDTCEAGEPVPMSLVNRYLLNFESIVFMVVTRLDVDRGFPGGSDSLWVMFSDPAEVTIQEVLQVLRHDIQALESAVAPRRFDMDNTGSTEEGGAR